MTRSLLLLILLLACGCYGPGPRALSKAHYGMDRAAVHELLGVELSEELWFDADGSRWMVDVLMPTERYAPWTLVFRDEALAAVDVNFRRTSLLPEGEISERRIDFGETPLDHGGEDWLSTLAGNLVRDRASLDPESLKRLHESTRPERSVLGEVVLLPFALVAVGSIFAVALVGLPFHYASSGGDSGSMADARAARRAHLDRLRSLSIRAPRDELEASVGLPFAVQPIEDRETWWYRHEGGGDNEVWTALGIDGTGLLWVRPRAMPSGELLPPRPSTD